MSIVCIYAEWELYRGKRREGRVKSKEYSFPGIPMFDDVRSVKRYFVRQIKLMRVSRVTRVFFLFFFFVRHCHEIIAFI